MAAEEARSSAPTVRTVCEQWIAHTAKQKGWTERYRANTEQAFELYLFQKVGSRRIADVTTPDLWDGVFEPMTRAGSRVEAARRLRQKLEMVWKFAITRHYVEPFTNAAAPLAGLLPTRAVRHFAYVPEQELAGLLAKVNAYGNVFIDACIRLQLLTATRPSEAREARWDEFDLEQAVWMIPAERMKKRRSHRVPLSVQALQVLRELRPYSWDDVVLFPSRSKPGVPMSNNTVGRCLRRLGYDVTAHRFRALFSTTANDAGAAAPHVIEVAPAHVIGTTKTTTEAAYNRATYFEARVALMQWWGDRVQTAFEGSGKTGGATGS